MSNEEKIQEGLVARFAFLKDALIIKRQRRISVDVAQENFSEVFDYLVKVAQFHSLCAITGLDQTDAIAIIYHLSRQGKIILNLKMLVSRQKPLLNSVTDYFPVADIYERELADLLGVQIEGLAAGHRYPLPDNWPQEGEYPLRKDWKPSDKGPKKEVLNA